MSAAISIDHLALELDERPKLPLISDIFRCSWLVFDTGADPDRVPTNEKSGFTGLTYITVTLGSWSFSDSKYSTAAPRVNSLLREKSIPAPTVVSFSGLFMSGFAACSFCDLEPKNEMEVVEEDGSPASSSRVEIMLDSDLFSGWEWES